MLVGYVSDERYAALPDVLLAFEGDGRWAEAHSAANGAVHVDIPPGTYRVTLAKPGFGSKWVDVALSPDRPHQFRLLSDCLLGYPWPKYVQAGEEAEFRVHSPEAYELELWRYGKEKEFIRRIGWFDDHGPRATIQIIPDGDVSQTGAQWNKFGYANPNLKQKVRAPERSGLYYFHARTASGLFTSFPWIVAPRAPTCRVAMLANNITWNAYNPFGGRSNYLNPDALPPTPTVNTRLDLPRYTRPDFRTYAVDSYAPLSFDRPEEINQVLEDERPTDPIRSRTGSHLASAEWRFLSWLEREGFAYDLWAETHLHEGQLDLDAYGTLIITTHPEYWTRKMYFQVKDWVRERGGRLIYLGGNGLNAEVEFQADGAIVIYNGNERERIARGGTDSRFHARVESEANLLGVAFTYPGIMTSAPYRVIDAGHWVFEGTGLKTGDLFGRESLCLRVPGGASGHETDKITASSPTPIEHLAKGINPDEGGADMVHYATPSGGAVFSTGSITWTCSILIDDAVSRITANVLRRFMTEASR